MWCRRRRWRPEAAARHAVHAHERIETPLLILIERCPEGADRGEAFPAFFEVMLHIGERVRHGW